MVRPSNPAWFGRLTPQIDASMARSYNEVILDSAAWANSLPHVIEAVFFIGGSTPGAEHQAREAQSRLVRFFNLTAAQMPLLRLDVRDFASPFVDVSEQ